MVGAQRPCGGYADGCGGVVNCGWCGGGLVCSNTTYNGTSAGYCQLPQEVHLTRAGCVCATTWDFACPDGATHTFAGCPADPCDFDTGGIEGGSWCLTAHLADAGEPADGTCGGESWGYCDPAERLPPGAF